MFVFVFVFVFLIHFWIAIIISFQKMHGFWARRSGRGEDDTIAGRTTINRTRKDRATQPFRPLDHGRLGWAISKQLLIYLLLPLWHSSYFLLHSSLWNYSLNRLDYYTKMHRKHDNCDLFNRDLSIMIEWCQLCPSSVLTMQRGAKVFQMMVFKCLSPKNQMFVS